MNHTVMISTGTRVNVTFVIMTTTLLATLTVLNQILGTLTVSSVTQPVGRALGQILSNASAVMIQIITSMIEELCVLKLVEMVSYLVISSAMMVTSKIKMGVHMIVSMSLDLNAYREHLQVRQCALRYVETDDV